MPPLTRWLIRTALAEFVLALLLSLLMAVEPLRAAWPWLAGAWPGYVHLFMVGWLTQLIVGVAFWLFPRRPGRPPAALSGWVGYGLMNSGLVLRVGAEPLVGRHVPAVQWILPLSAAAQVAAAVAWAMLLWPRVRAR